MPTSTELDSFSEIAASLAARVRDITREWEEKQPDHLALVEAGGSWTYRELGSAISAGQKLLRELGLQPGDRLMIVCDNCRLFVAVFLAASGMDVWTVPVNARLSVSELDQIREHCQPKRVLYTVAASPLAAKHAKRDNAETREIEGLGTLGIGGLNETSQAERVAENPADGIAAVIYTSGTTGQPKGVMLSHRNLLFMAIVSSAVRGISPQDRLLGILPMSHAVGLATVTLGTLGAGATLYIASRFDPSAVLASLERDKITLMLGAPSMFGMLSEFAKLKSIPPKTFADLRIISSSGAPLQLALKQDVERFFGMTLHNGYGVTECSPTIALTRLETPRSDTSVGRVFPGVRVRLVDAQGHEVPNGEVGELHVTGPNVMKGYYRSPEETSRAIDPDGWFNTRDLARMDGDHLFIVGRTKELIVRFGFNVYPAEVEGVLNAHPAILRSAVIGQTVGAEEEVVAFLQTKPDVSVTEEEISKHAAANLAPYKIPTRIFFVDEMPLTPTGKAKKDELARRLG